MNAFRHLAVLALLVTSAACGSDAGTTVDSADGELDVPRRKAPPYQPVPVTAAGSISGSVALAPADTAAAPPRAGAGPCARPTSVEPAVVVYLEDIARGRPTAPDIPLRYELTAAECSLQPSVTIASAGGTLNLSNTMNTVHQVAFVYEGMRNPMVRMPFSDPGQLVPSEKVLEIPGLVDVRSDLDPSVRARIVVVEHPYAVRATDGSFSMDSVPPGTYTLVAVSATGRAQTRVEVRAGATTPVTLQLQ